MPTGLVEEAESCGASDFKFDLKEGHENQSRHFDIAARAHQLRPSSRATKRPLDQVQVLVLLAGGVASQRVAMLVEERGISFEPNDRYLKSLKAAGAEDGLFKALASAKPLLPTESTPATAARRNRMQEHLARGAELAPRRSPPHRARNYDRAILRHGDFFTASKRCVGATQRPCPPLAPRVMRQILRHRLCPAGWGDRPHSVRSLWHFTPRLACRQSFYTVA